MPVIEVKSPMTARVHEVLVTVGDRIEEGQELLVLESMKMEIPVESPASGTVAALPVAAGASVTGNDVLISIEAEA